MYTLDYSDAILLYYLFFAKILPTFVTYICDKHFNIQIKFKSISLLNACIQHIQVKCAGYEINIGELGLKTKYFSSEYRKPLCVELEDVKINKTAENDLETLSRIQLVETSCESSKMRKDTKAVNARYVKWLQESSTSFLNYLLQFLPPTAMIMLQLLGIRVKNLSTTILNKENGPMASLNIPNIELTFDGCVVKNSRTLFIALALQHIKSKFFAYNKQNPSRKPHQACLAEVVVDISLEARVAWSGRKLLYEKLQVSVNNTQVTFYGGLFDMIENCMLHTKLKLPSVPSIDFAPKTPDITNVPVDVEKLIEILTPELLIIHVESTEVKSLNKQNSYHYHLLLQRVELKGKFKSPSSSRVKISNLRIYTPAHEVFYTKEACIDIKSSGNVFVIGTRIDTLNLVYNHDDIFGWFRKIILAGVKSNRKELIMRAFRTMNEKMIEFLHSEFTQEFFARVTFNHMLELCNLAAVLQLDDQVSSINASKLKFRLNQRDNELRNHRYDDYIMNMIFQLRLWSLEVISDGPLCWYMDQKFDYMSNESIKTYIRGTAFFLGSSFIRLSSNDNTFNLNLRVNTLRTEYSQKLTSFVIKSIKSFKEYVNLFTQLNSSKKDEANSIGKESVSIEKVLSGIALDAKVSNISCFFINRHDVCVFVNLSEISSEDSFNYNLNTFQVSAVDFTKYESVYDLSEFSTIYVSTKLLKVNLLTFVDQQPQIGVDFTEKLECSWNAHFLRHLLSLARDFHRFRRSAEDALGVCKEQKSLLQSLPVGLDIKKLRNIRIKHSDVNVDKLFLLINELSGENLFFHHYFH